MEIQERSDDLRASRSWEVVHRMPAQADAAQGEPEDKQAQAGASSSVEKIPGTHDAELCSRVEYALPRLAHEHADGQARCPIRAVLHRACALE